MGYIELNLSVKDGNLNIAVIVPCHNEALTISQVITKIKQALPQAQIYVFDNASTDDTAAIARQAGAELRFERNRGKGHVVRRALSDINADYFIMLDGDDTYDAAAAPMLLEHLISHHLDMVTGARVADKEAHRFGHRLGNYLFNLTISKLFERQFIDIFSGYRVFSRRFAKSFPCSSCGFEIETEMSIHALSLNLAVDEVPTAYCARPAGSFSKLHTVRDGIRISLTIMSLIKDFQPLSLFSLLAVLQLGFASWLFKPILLSYLATGMVPRLPTWVGIASLILLALMSFMVGIILDSIKTVRLEMRKLHFYKAH